MKILTAIFLTGLLAFAVGLYTVLPWWSFAITSLIVAAVVHQRPGKAFLCGFAGLFILWCFLALVKDVPNEHILSAKVAQILPMGGSFVVLILVTGIVGGLVSGLSSLVGSYLRK